MSPSSPIARVEWPGWQGALRRALWPHLGKLVVACAAMIVVSSWSFMRTMIAMPRHQVELRADVDSVRALATRTAMEVTEISEAFWIRVAMDCLALDQSDSVFVMTRLPCGKAYFRSGIRR